MTEVVSVKFKNRGKTYYFAAAGNNVSPGQDVIVETSKGLEFAQCVMGNHYVPDEKVIPPIRPVVRIATENDLRVAEINKNREREAFGICKKKIEDHGLDMKLVDVECSFEGNKITFFFTSDGRVDFRELVKDLASVFRNRIELRQIGVRDEAKMLGGIGICGRPFCCSQFLDDFQPVSTKMAKIQSMSLNPSKISGTCGRLMCCLRYEEEAYEDLVKTVPKNGAFVETPAGYGNVTQVNLLRRTVKVKLDGEGEDVFKTYSADEVAAIPGGRPKPGEPLPQLLKNRPAPERAEEEPEAAAEAKPRFYPVEAAESEPAARKPASEVPVRKRQGGRGRGKRQDAKPAPTRSRASTASPKNRASPRNSVSPGPGASRTEPRPRASPKSPKRAPRSAARASPAAPRTTAAVLRAASPNSPSRARNKALKMPPNGRHF
ncbi:MAG: regulatory iron-sulfur-containing complex subunit RicT [Lachnospiraceae bacterium]